MFLASIQCCLTHTHTQPLPDFFLNLKIFCQERRNVCQENLYLNERKRILELEHYDDDESTNELDLHHHRNWILFPKKKKNIHMITM